VPCGLPAVYGDLFIGLTEWFTRELYEKLAENPQLLQGKLRPCVRLLQPTTSRAEASAVGWTALQQPLYAEVLNEMSKDPKGTLAKYKVSRSVLRLEVDVICIPCSIYSSRMFLPLLGS
jgi:hypothetical protein